jgi:DNA-binding MarR family transcriptional regulator
MPRADLVLLLQACNAALGDRVLAASRKRAGAAVRYNDGYVFQHLVPGPLSVSDLARRLGVSQQAASQQVADLERRDLVRRRPDPGDKRARPVELTRRAWRAVEAARDERAAIEREVADRLGPTRTRQLLRALGDISDDTGALALLEARRLRPEDAR